MKDHTLLIEKITKQIEKSVNRRITGFPDAQWLSDRFTTRKLPISSQTIARLYGLIPRTKPYLSTLDNLARFLEYDNWENYIEDQTHHHFNSNIFLTEDPNGFSHSLLELALQHKQYDTIQLLLEKYPYFENNPIHFSTANLVGKYVKQFNYDDKLIQLLANTSAGRSLFFECYVDEDNQNNQFSNALEIHYLPKVSNRHDVFYVFSFLITQQGYSNTLDKTTLEKYHSIENKIVVHQLHYHLLSRYWECKILLEGGNNQSSSNYKEYLTSLSILANAQDKNEWLLARCIRAFLHIGCKKELVSHEKFNEVVNTTLMKKRKSKNSAALYIIQLYWLYSNHKDNQTYQPFHLAVDYLQGNSKERLAIETATTYLFARGNNKKHSELILKQHCSEPKLNWILNLVVHN